MYCLKCQAQNEESAHFCTNCGENLWYKHDVKSGNDISSTLLIIFVIIVFISNIIQSAIQLIPDWYSSPVKYVAGCFWILQSISFLLPALAIKDNTMKIIGIILASLSIVYSLYKHIMFLIF